MHLAFLPQGDGESWQYQDNTGDWAPFPEKAQKSLMANFHEGVERCQILIENRIYDVDFKVLVQVNRQSGKSRKIRCFLNLPSHWRITDEESLKLHVIQGNGQDGSNNIITRVTDSHLVSKLEGLLNTSKQRHDGTKCGCLHGNSTFRLVGAYQVKNLMLWRGYQRYVQNIRDKHKKYKITPVGICPDATALNELAESMQVDFAFNERLLFHGTRDLDSVTAIAQEGFDSRIAREGLFGRGAYFAIQTCKSAQYATEEAMKNKASMQMPGTLLLARVAIGDPYYTPGPYQGSRPPIRTGQEIRHDSIIAQPGIPNGQPGGVQAHMEVVTFAPEQAYPEYILRFIEE